MTWLRKTWNSWTPPERVVVGIAITTLLACVGAAAYANLKPAGDISNENVRFKAPEQGIGKAPKDRSGRSSWPVFGRDLARTKSINAPRIKPPFQRIWRYKRDELLEFAPILAEKKIFGSYNDGVFFAIEAKSGRLLWKRDFGKLTASTPAYYKGRLFAVSLNPGKVLAIRARDGRKLWERKLPSRSESSPVVSRGRLFFGTEGNRVFALRTDNGKVIWDTGTDGPVKAALALHKGLLYFGDYAGKVYALRADDGSVAWKTSGLSTAVRGPGRFYSTAAVAFGRVYLGNVDGRVYSLDERTGEIAWTRTVGGFVYSGIAATDTPQTDPTIYFGSHDTNVYALDARSGSTRWVKNAGGQISGPATAVGDLVYFSTFNAGGSTVGFDLKTGFRRFGFDDGQYGPVISDGRRLYLIGGSTVIAMRPVTKGKEEDGNRGVVRGAARISGPNTGLNLKERNELKAQETAAKKQSGNKKSGNKKPRGNKKGPGKKKG